ncbi:MAG: hypothetical protein SGCHY_003759 [Lobulomycetales sp.]
MDGSFEQTLKSFNSSGSKTSSLSNPLTGLFSSSSSGATAGGTQEQTSLLGSIQASTSSAFSHITGSSADPPDCLPLSTLQRMGATVLLLVLSAFCFLMAMMNLLTLAVSPNKFAVSYTFGSILALSASAIMRNFNTWIKTTFSWERYLSFAYPLSALYARDSLPFTLVYFGSIGATLYFSLGSRQYLPTLVCSIIQFIALASYFSGSFGSFTSVGRMASRTVGLPI